MKWLLNLIACSAFGGTLDGETIARILEKHFSAFLLYDVEARAITAGRGMDSGLLQAGSLLKPFLALTHAGKEFPVATCDGRRCWRRQGHGRVNLDRALAFSCNQYFLGLAATIDAEQLRVLMRSYGVEVPLLDTAEARIGLGTAALVSPKQLISAYAEMFHRGRELPVWHGLLLAATSGTANRFQGKVLAKTGTAACSRDEGDGLVVIGFPVQRVRWAVLVREHRVPGSTVAGRLAKVLEL